MGRSYGWLLNGKAVAQQSLAEQALLARDSQDPALAERIKQLLAVRSQLATLSQQVPKQGEEAAHRQQLVEMAGQEQDLARQVNLAAGRPAQDEPWIESTALRKALSGDAVLIDIAPVRAGNLRRQTRRGTLAAGALRGLGRARGGQGRDQNR